MDCFDTPKIGPGTNAEEREQMAIEAPDVAKRDVDHPPESIYHVYISKAMFA